MRVVEAFKDVRQESGGINETNLTGGQLHILPEEIGQGSPLAIRLLIKQSISAKVKIFRHSLGLSTIDVMGRLSTSKVILSEELELWTLRTSLLNQWC